MIACPSFPHSYHRGKRFAARRAETWLRFSNNFILFLISSYVRGDRDLSSRADHHQAKAAECEQKAKEAHEPEVKRDFAQLARQWCSLAEQAEQQGRKE
jgi:hypothetical protein